MSLPDLRSPDDTGPFDFGRWPPSRRKLATILEALVGLIKGRHVLVVTRSAPLADRRFVEIAEACDHFGLQRRLDGDFQHRCITSLWGGSIHVDVYGMEERRLERIVDLVLDDRG